MREIMIRMSDVLKGADNESCAQVTFVEKNGSKEIRYVTMDSLIDALRASTKKEDYFLPVGEIPFGYYDARIGSTERKFSAQMVAVLPPGRQMMRYMDTLYDVCMPSIVFHFTVRKGTIVKTRVFVLRDEKPCDNSKLYRYPFGNVSTDGTVCWGSNALPKINSLKDLEEAMLIFLQSPTNDDYFKGKDYCNHEDLSLRGLFEFLKDQDSYPEDYLVALKKDKKNGRLSELTPWRQPKTR